MSADSISISKILDDSRRIAVLGIKTEEQNTQPAFYVPKYLQEVGYEIIPVPVYYPDITDILGEQIYRTLAAIPSPCDIIVIFRRPQDIPAHLSDILAAKPRTVWMQSGIRNEEVAEALQAAGIEVIQDKCIMVEHRKKR